tara:strand:- start:284 stop:880 length:597 start_codon:yes stop_codon:yes gene_type:complete
MAFRTFVPSEPPKWLSSESWDTQFKRDVNEFHKLKTWTHHLHKLSLKTIETYKDNPKIPKWFHNLLLQEWAERMRPSLWKRVWTVYIQYKEQMRKWLGEIRDEKNPAGFSQGDSDMERFTKIKSYVRSQMSGSEFAPAESLNGPLADGEESESALFLISLLIYMIEFGFSMLLYMFLTGASEEEASWWAIILPVFELD